jgi:hypothetical protein
MEISVTTKAVMKQSRENLYSEKYKSICSSWWRRLFILPGFGGQVLDLLTNVNSFNSFRKPYHRNIP